MIRRHVHHTTRSWGALGRILAVGSLLLLYVLIGDTLIGATVGHGDRVFAAVPDAQRVLTSISHDVAGDDDEVNDDDTADAIDDDSDDGVDDDGTDNDGTDDDAEDDGWEGLILTRPSGTLTGTWTIQLGDDVTLTVRTDGATRFDPPVSETFAVGSFIEVEGVRQTDQSVLAQRMRAEDFEDGEVVVRFADNVTPDGLVDKYDLTLKSALLESANIYLFTTDDDESDQVAQIADEPGVIWAELNYINSVPENDGYKTWGWGGKDEPGDYAGQPAYFQISYGSAARQVTGAGVTVAVLDTGVYSAHEQFVGRLLLPSLDVISDDTDPSEVGPGLAWGHGTHVAGVIANLAPEATILPVRVLDQNGRGNTFLLAYAIEWAVNQGAQVINLSLGTDANSLILRDVVERAVEQGVIVVAAVGNGNTSAVHYPAGYAGVIGVTAVDAANRKADFANYGSDWVDIAAPGVEIMSTVIGEQGAGYATWSGTSMSTAFVTGAAALLLAQPAAQSAAVNPIVAALPASGDDIDAANPTYAGQLGKLLNVSRALGVDAPDIQYVWVPLLAR